MEEARSSFRRRVVIDSAPERTANEILGLAFELLAAAVRTSNRPCSDSVQVRPKRVSPEDLPFEEVMR